MPLISTVGRKSIHVRLLIACLYVVLTLGATTMVYPFLLMISGSFKSDVDKNEFDVLPAFFRNPDVLFRKHLEFKYNNQITEFKHANRIKAYEFAKVNIPGKPDSESAQPTGAESLQWWSGSIPPGKYNVQRVKDWKEFEAEHKPAASTYWLGYTQHSNKLMPWKEREFRSLLQEITDGDLDTFNKRFETYAESWIGVGRMTERLTERRYQLNDHPLLIAYYEFKENQPVWFRFYPSLDGKYVQTYLEATYGQEIDEYNKKHKTSWRNYSDITLRSVAPENELERKEWEHFVREELNLQFIRVRADALPHYRAFLDKQYAGDLGLLNRRYKTSFPSFEEAAFPVDLVNASEQLVDWAEFIKTVPIEFLYLTSPEIKYRAFLKNRYGDPDALNKAHGAEYISFEHVPLPSLEVDYADFLANQDAIRWEFMTANYVQVIDYIVLHGYSLFNTIVYCMLSILVSLTVNPIAAYALSRFRPPSSYKLLLFCMTTMAFPAAVTMIPSFLLVKNLGLLNTFWALILPGMANGFSIFLLKGFFDSLPRELYESATIDGAGEWVMFWHLTMSLSKPILAVLALGAFTQAYGNFMFAFILCPDEKMWTLMVFLYNLQYRGHMGLTFAALLVAAIPTFLVFVFCQNIIIRGIVVPVEK
ncbi:MAG: carbohydrate ABC transporter permease [Planctomycetota bacterium]|nr:carbohydrate ABC transporter permease [Planctomycetota bacterium]